ncbi:uncharacterized protein LOC133639897 [Entelurus aequoreus]|uniref:uncharacterized protein LOC133639897 n=1 Tax=Entelurus aequoreus TaxID=161455 RepID=UPI002B1E3953|nr:uncharacterized protein LOC133639897 [Entelurus aequoreus]
MMGASLILRTTAIFLTVTLQVKAVFCLTTKTLLEGESLEFKCHYKDGRQSSVKYFCLIDGKRPIKHLIRAKEHNKWVREGRFSLFDNTSGAFFMVRVDVLYAQDSGLYRCGVDACLTPDLNDVIQLNVSKGEPPRMGPKVSPSHCTWIKVVQAQVLFLSLEHNLMLFMAAIVCTAALISSDYETMTPAVIGEAEGHGRSLSLECITHPDAVTVDPTVGLRESSSGSLNLNEYLDLDLNLLEEHVYHNISRENLP